MRKPDLILLLFCLPFTLWGQHPVARLDSARAALNRNDFIYAAAWSRQIIETDSRQYEAFRIRAKAYMELGYYTLCTEDLNYLMNHTPPVANDFANRGYAFFMLQEYKAARSDFRKAFEMDTTSALYAFNLARVEDALYKWKEARAHYTNAIKLKPDYTEAYTKRGQILLMQEQFSAAIMDFDSALKYRQNDGLLLLYRGMALTSLKQYKEAIALFDRCIRLKSNMASAYFNRGLVRFQQRDYRNAQADLDSAIMINPYMEIAYYNRALCKMELAPKGYPTACDDFQKAVSLGFMEALSYLKKYCE